ncbi:hypothetical protein ACOQ0N_004220 [Vibrio parahaemolyticus]|nr:MULTISPECIES: hypothetical protein [Vibrio harveyi group]MCR9649867.1 hypothetical protein [Vibrio parahaemolyticus]MCR9802875.1 hypothetical protein [Vibrio parahaemolyticus]MCZ6308431.1 hypothetical protein [Vibrio parahaemolyticus]MDA0403963.1 hypothetical protein [Vibrio parahaemolyticus]MDF4587533.1 hypothetical protein [Vibrio parahaemolyticus]
MCIGLFNGFRRGTLVRFGYLLLSDLVVEDRMESLEKDAWE